MFDPSRIVVVGDKLHFQDKVYRCAVGKDGCAQEKREGDHKTPMGTFALRECWYREDKVGAPQTGLPLNVIRESDGWCDDAKSPDYNKHIALPSDYSHEKLWRDDDLYDVVIPIGYNDGPIIPGKGSAVFIHVATPDWQPTEGCVALAKDDLLAILPVLTPKTLIEIRQP